jgi:hypothetical protein
MAMGAAGVVAGLKRGSVPGIRITAAPKRSARYTGTRYRDMGERLLCLSVLDPFTDCWVWIGSRDRKGYGRTSVKLNGHARGLWAHRVSFEFFVGAIPYGWQLDHVCRNPSCINPDHLEPVPLKTNRERQAEEMRAGNTPLPRLFELVLAERVDVELLGEWLAGPELLERIAA